MIPAREAQHRLSASGLIPSQMRTDLCVKHGRFGPKGRRNRGKVTFSEAASPEKTPQHKTKQKRRGESRLSGCNGAKRANAVQRKLTAIPRRAGPEVSLTSGFQQVATKSREKARLKQHGSSLSSTTKTAAKKIKICCRTSAAAMQRLDGKEYKYISP